MASGRFAIATHALAVLATGGEGMTSDGVASSTGTHPVFLRKLLAALSRAGIVEAQTGPGGGYRLARSAETIPLCDVYRAVEPEGAIGESPCAPNPRCRIGAGIRAAFAEAARAGNDALMRGLSERTVADIARRAEQMGRRPVRGRKV